MFQIQVYTKRFCKNTKVTKSVQVSIKEGEEEKVEEMRGREKLVRTPQQVFVLWCFCICSVLICFLVLLYLFRNHLFLGASVFVCTYLLFCPCFLSFSSKSFPYDVILVFLRLRIISDVIFCLHRATTKASDVAEVSPPSWLGSGQTSR